MLREGRQGVPGFDRCTGRTIRGERGPAPRLDPPAYSAGARTATGLRPGHRFGGKVADYDGMISWKYISE